jgi:hypothetical protein
VAFSPSRINISYFWRDPIKKAIRKGMVLMPPRDGRFFPSDEKQGCQIFLATKYQNGENIPNYQKIDQIAIKYLYQMAVK